MPTNNNNQELNPSNIMTTAQANDQFAGITQQLTALEQSQQNIQRQQSQLQSSYERNLLSQAQAAADTQQQNLQSAQARGMTSTAGLQQTQQQTEQQRRESAGQLVQATTDTSEELRQAEADLLTSFKTVMQDPQFLAALADEAGMVEHDQPS